MSDLDIKTVEWVTSPPLEVGSRVAFVARFLGRRQAYENAKDLRHLKAILEEEQTADSAGRPCRSSSFGTALRSRPPPDSIRASDL